MEPTDAALLASRVSRPDQGCECVATLAVAATALAILGPGSVSLDGAISLADTLDGWVGPALGIGGAGAGVAQLAAAWRRPAGSTPPSTIEESLS